MFRIVKGVRYSIIIALITIFMILFEEGKFVIFQTILVLPSMSHLAPPPPSRKGESAPAPLVSLSPKLPVRQKNLGIKNLQVRLGQGCSASQIFQLHLNIDFTLSSILYVQEVVTHFIK